MTVALITGSHGFVGSHLRPLLAGVGWSVVGIGRSAVEPAIDERYRRVDVTDLAALADVLDAERPDVVFHLAAVNGHQVADPVALTHDVLTGTQVVCAAIRRVGIRPRLVLAGSSAQYGATSLTHTRVAEDDPLEPVSAYGHAKVQAEAAAFEAAADGAFDLVAARAFNHVGPGEPPTTVCGAVAARVRSVLDGHAERAEVADLAVVRDFTDVRDIARGYLALATAGTPGTVYNLCSGRAATVGDVVDGLLEAAGLDRSKVAIMPDTGSGIAYQVGSPTRTETETGWSATIPLRDSLADLLARPAIGRGSTPGAPGTTEGPLDGT